MFTKDQVIEAAKMAVASKPAGYVYERANSDSECAYSEPSGKPSCFIGTIFSILEPEFFAKVAEAEWIEDEFGPFVKGEAVAHSGEGVMSRRNLCERYTTDALNLMVDWQGQQDRGTPWDQLV